MRFDGVKLHLFEKRSTRRANVLQNTQLYKRMQAIEHEKRLNCIRRIVATCRSSWFLCARSEVRKFAVDQGSNRRTSKNCINSTNNYPICLHYAGEEKKHADARLKSANTEHRTETISVYVNRM